MSPITPLVTQRGRRLRPVIQLQVPRRQAALPLLSLSLCLRVHVGFPFTVSVLRLSGPPATQPLASETISLLSPQ